jgi:hypothetical protein
MRIGGSLAGGAIAGFGFATAQLIRLRGDVAGPIAQLSRGAAEVAALGEVVRTLTPGGRDLPGCMAEEVCL